MSRPLTQDEMDFIETLTRALPPVIAREEVKHFTGGLVSPQTIAHADCKGRGPADAFRVGRKVGYKSRALAEWMVRRFGVARIENISSL